MNSFGGAILIFFLFLYFFVLRRKDGYHEEQRADGQWNRVFLQRGEAEEEESWKAVKSLTGQKRARATAG